MPGAFATRAVRDGDGNNVLFNVMAADYTYFEGLTFRNTNIAIGLSAVPRCQR